MNSMSCRVAPRRTPAAAWTCIAVVLVALLCVTQVVEAEDVAAASSRARGGVIPPNVVARYKPPVVLTMFGAKPPGSVLRNMTRQYLARQLAKTSGARPQKDMSALIVPNYVEVNLPEEKSGEGIELLLRGFAEIAVSGRELRAADYRNLRAAGIDGADVLCADDPAPPGLVGPACFGRVPKVVPFTRAPISFYVHEANPVHDMSAAQFERIAAAYRKPASGGGAPTWGSVFPEANWASNPMLKDKSIDAFFSDVAGGQRGWVEKGTGVSLTGVPDSNDNQVAALFSTSDTGLAFRTNVVYGSPPPHLRFITFNVLPFTDPTYPIKMTFNLIFNSASGAGQGNTQGGNALLPETLSLICEGIMGYNYTLTGAGRDEMGPVDGAELALARSQAGCV